MNIENYTPHKLVICSANNKWELESLGNIRLTQKVPNFVEDWNGVPVYTPPTYKAIEGIPKDLIESKTPRIIAVSMPVGLYIREHPDTFPENIQVWGPDTSPNGGVRNEKGEIIGTKALIKYR